MSETGAAKTPLLDLLRGVPADGRHVYEHHSTHHQSVPYGRLCGEAAGEIERLEASNKVLVSIRNWARIISDSMKLSEGGDEFKFTGSTNDIDALRDVLDQYDFRETDDLPDALTETQEKQS